MEVEVESGKGKGKMWKKRVTNKNDCIRGGVQALARAHVKPKLHHSGTETLARSSLYFVLAIHMRHFQTLRAVSRMSSTIPLSEIPTISLLYKLNKLQPASSTHPAAASQYNDKISLIRNDITKLETDAIVNAANESLLGGGGVDGAIHRAAGPELVAECELLDGCDTGSAKITGAYELPCKKVIHAVGPVYHSTKRQGRHTTLLQGCYTTSLDLAVQNNCKSIAFSALSTGVYGYPSDEAADTAIQAVKGWLDKNEERAAKIDRIVFCQFMAKDEQAYEEYIPYVWKPNA